MNILLSLISGLLGVLIGSKLSQREELRKEQLSILKTLVTYRSFPAQPERITALNVITIVFFNCPDICSCLENYKKAQNDVTDNLTVPQSFIQKLSALDDAYIKLLEAIARHLGYGESLSWDKLKNPYIAKSYIGQNGNLYWY